MAKDISKKDLAAKKARRAQKEMLAYMEENDLDPKKDWTGHKKHGKKIQAWETKRPGQLRRRRP